MESVVRVAGMLLAGTFLFVDAVLIACLWLIRLKESPVSPRWRWIMSWASISLATAALGAWIGTLTYLHQKTIEQTIHQTQHGVHVGLALSLTAVVAALLAKGKGRSWTAASALIIPGFIYPIWVASAVLG
jgi:hypothetical protein